MQDFVHSHNCALITKNLGQMTKLEHEVEVNTISSFGWVSHVTNQNID